MSTVRIQVRRGTSSEWTTANPVLAAGEMGVETNTNKFKFGNGSSTWTALSYAAADTAAIGEISQDAIDQALSMGAGLTKTYNDGTNTITISVDSDVVATVAYVDAAVTGINNSLTGYLETGDRGTANGVASLNSSAKILESELDLDGISLNIATSGSVSGDSMSTAELVATDITSGGQIDANNVVISGNLTVTGTTTTVNTTNLSVSDPIIQVASDNSANTVDVGFVGHYNDGTSQHTGLVRDSSESKWKLFNGVTTSPTTNVDFTQGSLDALAVGAFEASSASIGNVSNTELQYLNGVTSPIQTQIVAIHSDIADVEANIDTIETNLNLYALKASPTISDATLTGTLSLPDDSVTTSDIANDAVTTAKIADASINNAKIAADAAIAQTKIAGLADSFAEKAPLESPTFTGSVVLPSATSIGNLSSTEIGYLDGITSSVQTQITAAGTALSNHESDTTNIHGIADTAELATKSYADTAEADAITAAGTAADSKIATAVSALTKSSVGLGNVDNTSDANKPVSTATQTALDLKANLSAPTFTGTVTSTNDLVVDGNLTVNGTTFSASSTSITIEDNMVQLAHENAANTVDLGLVVAYNDGSAKHAGIVRDVSDAKWKLFKGVTTEPTTTVNFGQGSLDDLAVGALEATTVTPSSGIVFSDGTQTKLGVPSITTFATEISASATLAAGEQDKFVPLTGAVTITLPATGYSTGQSIDFYQASGTGAQFASTNSVVGTPGLKFRTTNSVVTAMKTSSGWLVFGDLSA
jgi:hypothetical protein